MKNEKILVFGASGDTGTYFVRYFLDHYNDSEYEVVAVGTRETDRFARMGVPYYRVDITQKNAFDCLPKDIYAVVDLAGAMPARMKGYDPYKYIDVNIIGTLNILEFCRKPERIASCSHKALATSRTMQRKTRC